MSSRSDQGQKRSAHRHHRLLKWALGALAAVMILGAVLVGLFRVAANLVPRYHDEIQQQIAAQLGAKVSIGPVSLAWRGWGPALIFRNVQVLNPKNGAAVISARELRLDFSPIALLHGASARPSAFHVVQPRVTLEQLPDGRFVVPGINPPAGKGPSPLKGMLGDGVYVRDGRLQLHLAGGHPAVWTFSGLGLRIASGRHHRVSLAVTLPQALGGGRFQVGGRVDTPDTGVNTWHWQGHFTLEKLNLAGSNRFLPQNVPALDGHLAISSEFQGHGLSPTGASGRLRIGGLAAGGSRIAAVSTRFDYAGGKQRILTFDAMQLVNGNRVWRPGRIQVRRDPSGRLRVLVHDLHLDLVPALVGFLPASRAALKHRLVAMHPSGQVEDFSFSLTPGGTDFGMQGTLRDVSVAHADSAPGFEHLSARVDIRRGVGQVTVDAPGLTLLMPKLFGHPVALDTAKGTVLIGVGATGLYIGMPHLALTGPALSGALEGVIHVPRGGSPHIRLAAYVNGTDAVAAREHYLPHGLLAKPLDNWLMHSLSGGKLTGARLYFDGPVKGFPYEHGGGYFGVDFGYEGVSLSPGFGWAPMKQLSGRVRFENAGMRATITHGVISGAHVINGSAAIPDFFHLHLQVHADVAGDAGDFLTFLRHSPVSKQLGGALDPLHAEGPTRTKLDLNLPIMHPKKFQLKGHLYMNGVTARYGRLPFALTNMRGEDTYDGKGPLRGRFVARFKGAPVVLKLGRSQSKGAVRAELAGKLPATVVDTSLHVEKGKYFAGRLPLNLMLTVPLRKGGPPIALDMRSSLRGFAVKLPAPLGKPATSSAPLTAHMDIRGRRLTARARYGTALSGCADIDARTNVPAIRALHLILGSGGGCRSPSSGLLVTGGWSELDLGAWLKLMPKHPFAGRPATRSPQFDHLGFDLRFGTIRLFKQAFANESLSGLMGPDQFRVSFAGRDLAGKAVIPRQPTNTDPIVADIAHGRFAIPQKHSVVAPAAATVVPPTGTAATVASVKNLARSAATANAAAAAARTGAGHGESLRPDDFPPFALHADHLELGGAHFDNVLIRARRLNQGIAFDPLRVGGGTMDFKGMLVWVQPKGGTGHGQGSLRFISHVHNLGVLLKAAGLGPVITGHGAASAALAWSEQRAQGAAFADQLLGRVSVDLRDGQISEVNPGAGRLLSLLNLANLPRYLTFNFHNLTGKGFPFNRIHGDYDINRGIAETGGLIIDSSVAWIKLTGSLNLKDQIFNQHATIEPNYTGNLPIIGALVGGLGVGAAVFAVTKIFGSVIGKVSQINYSITGPFSHPTVKQVGRSASPPSATHASAAPSSGSTP